MASQRMNEETAIPVFSLHFSTKSTRASRVS
jgi:hypothetical protein